MDWGYHHLTTPLKGKFSLGSHRDWVQTVISQHYSGSLQNFARKLSLLFYLPEDTKRYNGGQGPWINHAVYRHPLNMKLSIEQWPQTPGHFVHSSEGQVLLAHLLVFSSHPFLQQVLAMLLQGLTVLILCLHHSSHLRTGITSLSASSL